MQAVLDGHIFCVDVAEKLLDIEADTRPFDYAKAAEVAASEQSMQSVNSLGDNYEESEPEWELYTKREVAAAIQNEVKALLYDYLTVSDQSQTVTVPVLAIAEMLKDNRKGFKRPMKQIYHIKMSADDPVKKMLLDHCPKLAEAGRYSQAKHANDHEVLGLADRYDDVIEGGHRKLVNSSPSYILLSYRSTLEFMRNMEHKIGLRLPNFKMFLEDFIFNVYLPQIQEQVLVYFHANVNGIDAFQTDLYPDVPFPLIKSALCMVLEMHGISRTIKYVPVHADELVKFIEFTLKKFYEKCFARFKNILSAVDSHQDDTRDEEEEEEELDIVSVQWAQDPELTALFAKNSYLGQKKV
jgi:exocyst complex component 4